MELKQINFFVTAAETGSFGKAAAKLYTSQPNISKVIRSLEKELGYKLFERTPRGLVLTEKGQSIYHYAKNILENAAMLTNAGTSKGEEYFRISTYSSHVLMRVLTELYQRHPEMKIDHLDGNVEEITENVSRGISELGILFVSKNNLTAFQHILQHRDLEFHLIAWRRACVYLNKKNPYYDRENLRMEELPNLRLIGGSTDFFSIQHHYAEVNVGLNIEDKLNDVVKTNSEHLATDLLNETDLAVLSVDLRSRVFNPSTTKVVYIEGEDADLAFGYITRKERALSAYGEEFLELVHELPGMEEE
ncbi:MAG: LysR family transcriptional regulator [Eubacteriales bacterium]|nr:LysR family transcriptional regulator [Eubacteriales bacterium]